MRINQEFRDVLSMQLLTFGFTDNGDSRSFSLNGVIVRFLPANHLPHRPLRGAVAKQGDSGKMYTVNLRNQFAARQILNIPASATTEIDIRNIAAKEAEKNDKLLTRRNRLCEEIKAYCDERRVPVEYKPSKTQNRTVTFTLRGWEHVLFRLQYDAEHNKFYVRMAGDHLLYDDVEDEEDEFFAWVENGNDVAAWAEKAFDPKMPAQGNDQISTLGEPGQWLHWMFTYGVDKLETIEVMTHRKSDSQLVNALIPDDSYEVTLSTIKFIDRLPFFKPREKKPSREYEAKKARPKLDISNE